MQLRAEAALGDGLEQQYQLLAKPYRRDAPYDSLDELPLSRRVTDDFWSAFLWTRSQTTPRNGK